MRDYYFTDVSPFIDHQASVDIRDRKEAEKWDAKAPNVARASSPWIAKDFPGLTSDSSSKEDGA